MNYQAVVKNGKTYVECLPGEEKLASEQDALDLVGACSEYSTDRLLLHHECLTEDFYELRTRIAGDIMLKFSNYRIRTAAVLTPELVGQGRFYEMVIETNRGSQFRVFYDRDSAEAWLVGI